MPGMLKKIKSSTRKLIDARHRVQRETGHMLLKGSDCSISSLYLDPSQTEEATDFSESESFHDSSDLNIQLDSLQNGNDPIKGLKDLMSINSNGEDNASVATSDNAFGGETFYTLTNKAQVIQSCTSRYNRAKARQNLSTSLHSSVLGASGKRQSINNSFHCTKREPRLPVSSSAKIKRAHDCCRKTDGSSNISAVRRHKSASRVRELTQKGNRISIFDDEKNNNQTKGLNKRRGLANNIRRGQTI